MNKFRGTSSNSHSLFDPLQMGDIYPPNRCVGEPGLRSAGSLSQGYCTLLPVERKVRIVEQPAKCLRFRYECEGRFAGTIPGENNAVNNKTFPTIKIDGYVGAAIVVVSCVTADELPSGGYRPHPHSIAGKDGCKDGVCSLNVNITADNSTLSFSTIGIQCVKKKDVKEAMELRKKINVDPFKTNVFDDDLTSYDLSTVRLCFEVYVRNDSTKQWFRMKPVVSNPIADKKAAAELSIYKLSHCSASALGGMEMILLCEKVSRDDVKVRFFEESNGTVAWEDFGFFLPSQVHRQVAIPFRTPAYKRKDIKQPVEVFIQLTRPSDNCVSEAMPFQITPSWEEELLRRKRQRSMNSSSNTLLQSIQMEAKKHHREAQPYQCPELIHVVKPERSKVNDNACRRNASRPPTQEPLNLKKVNFEPTPNVTITQNFQQIPHHASHSLYQQHHQHSLNVPMAQQQNHPMQQLQLNVHQQQAHQNNLQFCNTVQRIEQRTAEAPVLNSQHCNFSNNAGLHLESSDLALFEDLITGDSKKDPLLDLLQ